MPEDDPNRFTDFDDFMEYETCNALILSGGGSNGAWEAGVLWGLVNFGDSKMFEYDVVAGVSAGAINAAGLAVWEKGKEKEAVEWMSSQWNNRNSDDFYVNWPGGFLQGLFTESSLYDGSPQEESLRHIFKGYDGFKREISISAVDINSGQIITFTEKNTKFEEYHHAIIASASVPGAFPPHRFHDHLLVDGMAAYNTNVQQAIDRCRERVDPRHLERITIDIIIC